MCCQKLVADISPDLDKTIPLHHNNNAAITLVYSDNYHACMKHMSIHYNFIHEAITKLALSLHHRPTEDMTADILTKPLPSWKTSIHAAGLGLHNRFPINDWATSSRVFGAFLLFLFCYSSLRPASSFFPQLGVFWCTHAEYLYDIILIVTVRLRHSHTCRAHYWASCLIV